MKKTIPTKQILTAILFCAFHFSSSAQNKVTISGIIKDNADKSSLPFVTVSLLAAKDSSFISGTVTEDDGRFTIADVSSGNYFFKLNYLGYQERWEPLLVGTLSTFLDKGTILLLADTKKLNEVVVTGNEAQVSSKMDKKTFTLGDNIAQAGSSALEAMKNLPGITVQDGKVQLRGSDKISVLIDGRQTALTGISGQSGLENIPASAIEKIEIINNPSAKFDANGNAGIINIIYKKEKKEGLNGQVGLVGGLGALWIKRENLPTIRPQYQATPKINPSFSLNYRKNKVNLFFQGDNLYTQTLNKNEFVDRYYDNGTIIKQQTKRNRSTNIITGKTGIDWNPDESNTLMVSALFSSEKILDRGDEPFFNSNLSERQRLWQFIEDELKTTVTASTGWQHKYRQPGRQLNIGFNYTFHRENEQYFFTNILPAYTGLDSFKLLSDEQVADLNIDYVQPLKYGRIEGGMKFRYRYIPVNMKFIPGLNSPLDTNAGGWANYSETIPALYGNYVFENRNLELEAGLRVEYVGVQYDVDPQHNTYKSDQYHYTQPFPNMRLGYKINDNNRLSFFYNRRVDRANEVDIRIFPKYDDAEIVKLGNPALRPQFTNTIEIGYKLNMQKGMFYASVYHKVMDATITRIASITPGSNVIYNIFQNAGRSYNTGTEMMLSQNAGKWGTFNVNLNAYKNTIEAFTVTNLYPKVNIFSAGKQDMYSGNIKLNSTFHLPRKIDAQLTAIYLAPDIIPQGKIGSRFSVDLGFKKTIQKGKGFIFLNATDIANTLRIKKEVQGDGFRFVSTDYYETQVLRLGYNYKF